jgi:tetratricopeptide (TPR) repeat protein
MARLEDMSPEEAFAAWEALLAESEGVEEAPPAAEVVVPEPPTPAGPVVIEEPEKEALAYPEDAAERVPDAEADLMARLEDMSPEDAFAAWEALLAESEEVVSEEELPAAEAVAEAEEVWMALEEDQSAEEIEALAMVEEPLPIEPIAELDQPDVPTGDQAWMTLAADEGLEEITAPPIPEAAPTFKPTVTWETVDEEGLEDLAPPPGLEEAPTVESVAETVAKVLPDIGEPIADRLEALEEDIDLAEPELPERPTWVAIEEPLVAERPVAEAPPEEPPVTERPVAQVPMVEEQIGEPEDDQTHLELARRLWTAGQKEEAQAAYQELLSSPLRDDVTADLEMITGEGVPEETMLRLLGDAYMRENRLQEALDVYRRALASL